MSNGLRANSRIISGVLMKYTILFLWVLSLSFLTGCLTKAATEEPVINDPQVNENAPVIKLEILTGQLLIDDVEIYQVDSLNNQFHVTELSKQFGNKKLFVSFNAEMGVEQGFKYNCLLNGVVVAANQILVIPLGDTTITSTPDKSPQVRSVLSDLEVYSYESVVIKDIDVADDSDYLDFSFDYEGSGEFVNDWKYHYAIPGEYTIIVRVDDGLTTVLDSFKVIVLAYDENPSSESTPVSSTTIGSSENPIGSSSSEGPITISSGIARSSSSISVGISSDMSVSSSSEIVSSSSLVLSVSSQSLSSSSVSSSVSSESLSSSSFSSSSSSTPQCFDTNTSFKASADTYMRNDLSARRNDNYGCEGALGIGTQRSPVVGDADAVRTMIQFDLSGEVGPVQQAILTMTVHSVEFHGDPSPFVLDVHRVTDETGGGAWEEGNGAEGAPIDGNCVTPDAANGAAWDGTDANNQTMPSINSRVYASETIGAQGQPQAGDIIEFDITALVNQWIAGTYPNYGVVIRDITSPGYFKFLFLGSRDTDLFTYPYVSTQGPQLSLVRNGCVE